MAVRKVRRLKFGGKLFLIFLSIIILVISIGCYFLSNFSIFRERKKTVEKVEKTEKYPQKYSFDLFMVGDALIHSAVYEDALLSNGNYDFKPMLEYIKPISSGYDLSYYNQETILGGANLGYSNYPRFNSPDAVGDAFVDEGVKVLENNVDVTNKASIKKTIKNSSNKVVSVITTDKADTFTITYTITYGTYTETLTRKIYVK